MDIRWIYILCAPFSLRSIGRVKVGVASETESRKDNIAKTSNLSVFKIAQVPSVNALPVEQWAHRILSPLHAPLRYGSGRTEWFWNCPLVSGLICLYYFGFSSVWPYVIISLLPIDIALFVLILSAIDFIWHTAKYLIMGSIIFLIFAVWKGISGL